jgi:succinate-semialdehyde dehydrogenase / glutarate-semialdehyde dehydrogenase
MQSVNPFTLQLIETYVEDTDEIIAAKISAAESAFEKWKTTDFSYRAEKMLQLAEQLRKQKTQLSELMTMEMGKPIRQSEAEIEKCAWVCEYYAAHAAQILSDKMIETDASKSYVRYNPLGVILAVMPWNFPFWQYFRFIAPNAMAGNVGLLKHASNVSGCALAIDKLFSDAGFPEGVSQTLLIPARKVQQVLEHPAVKAATLTGSEAAGASVASIAGKNIKKTVLELGGSNAAIVMNDASIDKIIETCVMARFQNAGQSCIAAKRFLVQSEIYDAFLEKFTEKVMLLKTGNPLDAETRTGPMATVKLAMELEAQMQQSVKMGASIHLGGKRENALFEPTILTNVTPDMPVFKEETFGPLAAIVKFNTIEEAIQLSNQSEFGLGVSLFTENIAKAELMINQFDEGAVFINELVKSDPRLPFGGIKKSGYGRELSDAGLLEFVNQKTVFIR